MACCKPGRAKLKVAAVAAAMKKVDQPHQGEKKAKARKASAPKAKAKKAAPCKLCGKQAQLVAQMKARKK